MQIYQQSYDCNSTFFSPTLTHLARNWESSRIGVSRQIRCEVWSTEGKSYRSRYKLYVAKLQFRKIVDKREICEKRR